jgi:hypothetical protein
MAPSSIGGGAEAPPFLACIVTVSFVTKHQCSRTPRLTAEFSESAKLVIGARTAQYEFRTGSLTRLSRHIAA